MKTIILLFVLVMLSNITTEAQNLPKAPKGKAAKGPTDKLQQRLSEFAPVKIKADLSSLSNKQIILIQKLCDAGRLADEIFWRQTSPDAISVREELKTSKIPRAKELYKYVLLNYGPYDRIFDEERFYGKGPLRKPVVSNFYPQDMTKDEFEKYVAANPGEKEQLESPYTVVARDGDKFKAIPFNTYYPEVHALANKLEECAGYTDDPDFKHYLTLRAKAIKTDNYFESDMDWMTMKNNPIEIVIGPIENYEDGLFNYKTAYEAIVCVRDNEATKELEYFTELIDNFEFKLPYDRKYIRESAGGLSNIIAIMNVVYFGGDCQKSVKTIATSLPNDPEVIKAKGAKKLIFKNMMEAKFDLIVKPIAERLLDPSLLPFVDKSAFTSFVVLHEVSHTLGRNYVYGNDNLSVRKAMKELYSAIEETKADIVGMYNHKHLLDMNSKPREAVKKSMVTYIAGLYRSIRFGADAHGTANLIQLNFLKENGIIIKSSTGKIIINEEKFFEKVKELARIVLTIEATGDYAAAENLIKKYGHLNKDLNDDINSLNGIPRDLDTSYDF
ncbi:MAG: MutT/NUDIX family protein [Ignavibacteria bacterium]|nr:MutT/NUDIX family protein [Ignavibacteria bacterium]